MKKRKPSVHKIVNRRARFDYELGNDLVVGIVLTGKETKALRQGHGQLRGAFVSMKNEELWLNNATINNGKTFTIPEEEQTRARKLLAKRKEIDGFAAAKQQGRTIVPLEFLIGGRTIKLKIAIGKGKKSYDKRDSIKKRDLSREALRNLKH